MKIYGSVAELVGKTPLRSVKDRVALEMIEDAEKNGKLKKGCTIIEPTSGNTGIGLAAIGTAKGYKVVITMPNTMSAERIALMKAYGAEVILTDGKLGMTGAIEKANELQKEIEGSIVAGQFVNPANPKAHEKTTGPEIWEDTDGKVDIFVAGIGTGGTISGTGRYLKSQNPNVKVVGIEPADSPVLSKGEGGSHKLQGIGAGFVPEVLDVAVYDEIITVTTEEAYSAVKTLAKKEGILVGISSGAALSAAIEVANRSENEGKMVVVLLPDTGDRYLSTEMFTDN